MTTMRRQFCEQLLQLDLDLELLKYSSRVSGVGKSVLVLPGRQQGTVSSRTWLAKLASLGCCPKAVWQISPIARNMSIELTTGIEAMVAEHGVGDRTQCSMAANYLFDQHSTQTRLVCSGQAHSLYLAFQKFLHKKQAEKEFADSVENESLSAIDRFLMIRDWVASFVNQARCG